MKRFMTGMTIALLAVGILSGCTAKPSSSGAGVSSNSESQLAESESMTSAAASGNEETILFTHAMGETEIPVSPKRVVILTNEGTEALIALGVKPVGAANSYITPWYEHISADMEGVKELGKESEINLEALIALEPDLIIANKMRHEEIYPQLSAIAPTICSDTLRGEWKTNFMLYANALGKEKEGQEMIDAFDARTQTIAQENPEALETEVSIVRFMNGKTRIYLGDTFSGIILKQIGFARPASQQSEAEFVLEIEKERLPEADGDVMFYFTYETGDGAGDAREQEWINDPLFQSLDVVKAGKYHKVSDTIWNTSGGIISANKVLDDIEQFIADGVFETAN